MAPSIKKTVSVAPLTKEVIAGELRLLNDGAKFQWNLLENVKDEKPITKLTAHYKLKNYPSTWTFLGHIARKAHEFKHHPTIVNTYNKIDLEITTHDAGNQVTLKDIQLAKAIQDLYRLHFLWPSKFSDLKSTITDLNSQSSLSNASKIIEGLIAVEQENEHNKK